MSHARPLSRAIVLKSSTAPTAAWPPRPTASVTSKSPQTRFNERDKASLASTSDRLNPPRSVGRRPRLHLILLVVPLLTVRNPKPNHPGTRPRVRHSVDQPRLDGSNRNPKVPGDRRLAHPATRIEIPFRLRGFTHFGFRKVRVATSLDPSFQIQRA